jgi:hypothetical protein
MEAHTACAYVCSLFMTRFHLTLVVATVIGTQVMHRLHHREVEEPNCFLLLELPCNFSFHYSSPASHKRFPLTIPSCLFTFPDISFLFFCIRDIFACYAT